MTQAQGFSSYLPHASQKHNRRMRRQEDRQAGYILEKAGLKRNEMRMLQEAEVCPQRIKDSTPQVWAPGPWLQYVLCYWRMAGKGERGGCISNINIISYIYRRFIIVILFHSLSPLFILSSPIKLAFLSISRIWTMCSTNSYATWLKLYRWEPTPSDSKTNVLPTTLF